jgi:hypothetical protein
MRHAISLAIASLLFATAAAGDNRTVEGRARLAPGQEVRLDFPVGRLEVVGVRGDEVRLEVEGRCKRSPGDCDDHLQAIEIDIRERDGELWIEVSPHPKWRWWDSLEIEAKLTYPAGHPLTIDMSVGELTVDGLRGDLDVDLGVGDVSVDMPGKAVNSVYLDAGIGETELLAPEGWVRAERSFLVGSETNWRHGPGDARVHIDVGVGEIVVRLD